MDEQEFRLQFQASGAVMMMGIATDEFAAQLAEQTDAARPAAVQG
jgi:hypothetical protein